MINHILMTARKMRNDYTSRVNLLSSHSLIVTFFGAGLLIPAPGLWGSAAAFAIGLCIQYLCGILGLIITCAILSLVGFWAIQETERQSGIHDSSVIVVDEAIAVFLILIALNILHAPTVFYMAAFIIFRMCDSIKPWPINWCDENISGAAGVIIDDIVAAFMTILIISAGVIIL
jgi:phosphatidylglycerophosphatase A